MKNYNKEMILNICDSLVNYQDKFIVYGLHQGIEGDDYTDLLGIKVSDVNEDFTYINLRDRGFVCDEYMTRILKGTVKSKMYYNDINSDDYCYFNEQSEYVIKSIPTSTNDGLTPLSKDQLEKKLNEIKNLFEEQNPTY